jgi:hypothetical protein
MDPLAGVQLLRRKVVALLLMMFLLLRLVLALHPMLVQLQLVGAEQLHQLDPTYCKAS